MVLLGGSSTLSIATGDVDGDQDVDVISGNFGDNFLWRWDGSGFVQDLDAIGAGSSQGVALGDLDGDLDLDLVFGNFGEGNTVFLNDGVGVFTDTGQALGTDNTLSIALGDVDGDGDLDLWEGISVSASKLWLNDGAGVFTDSGLSIGTTAVDVTLVDIDLDGHLDAFTTTGGNPFSNQLFLGDGAGGFVDAGFAFGNDDSNASAVGDIDGNATPDLFVVSFYGDHRCWLNDTVSPLLFEDDFESGDLTAWDLTIP